MKRNGFTLVETLVALALLSVVALAGVVLLDGTRRTVSVTSTALAGMRGLERTRAQMLADFAQILPVVQGGQPALLVDEQGMLARFVTAHGDGSEAVAYRLRRNRLERVTPEGSATLVADIGGVVVRSRSGGVWQDGWHDPRPRSLPDAIEVTLLTRRWGWIRQVFVVGVGR